jgi:Tfp pilus assembly protein PilF
MNKTRELLEQGRRALMAGDRQEARRLLERSLELEPGSGEAWHAYATLLFDAREDRSAIAAAREALATVSVNDHELRQQMYVVIGMGSAGLGDRAAAEDAFRHAVQEEPSVPGWLGLYQSLADRSPGALVCLEEACQLEPRNALVHFLLGKCFLKREELSDAERHFRRAVRNAPKDAEYRLALGELFLKRRRWVDAFFTLYDAVQLDRTSGDAYLAFAHIVALFGNFKAAAKHFRKALRLMPESMDARWEYGLFLAFFVRNIKRARQEFEKAAAINPAHRAAVQTRAKKWLRVARAEKRALRQAKENPDENEGKSPHD